MIDFLTRWRDMRNVPVSGFLVQGAIALLLVGFGALEHSGFTWLNSPLRYSGLLPAERHGAVRAAPKDPNLPRPFMVPGYPVLPVIFVATCAYLLYSSVTYA